jgi:hypothetical protein
MDDGQNKRVKIPSRTFHKPIYHGFGRQAKLVRAKLRLIIQTNFSAARSRPPRIQTIAAYTGAAGFVSAFPRRRTRRFLPGT